MNQLNQVLSRIFSRSQRLPQSGAVTDPGNYRPIAVLSPFSKILERLVYNQLSHFLEKENILFKHQFGSGKIILLSKQFLNSLTILKWKLTAMKLYAVFFLTYGIRGVPLQWFKSYLESRTQYAEIENVKSNPLSIQCGVPQGSTLGPLLFLTYINDMPKCLEKANIRTFADDTNLLYSSNSLQDLEKTINEEFNHLLSYCLANKNFL